MIVIHPNDGTTSFLNVLYKDKENITKIDETWRRRDILKAIGESDKSEIIMMLGHGSEHGLYAPSSGSQFGKLIVDHKMHDLLQGRTCIGIWCNAIDFAKRFDLSGLFTGMIISEEEEAVMEGVDIYGEDLNLCNKQFALDLDYCIRHHPLYEIPSKMLELQDYHSNLKDFNYNSIFTNK